MFVDKTNYISDHAGSFEGDCSGRVKVRNNLPLIYKELVVPYEAWKNKVPADEHSTGASIKIESFEYTKSMFPSG